MQSVIAKKMGLPAEVTLKKFLKDLYYEINCDNVFNGAAALGYYLLLATVPAIIFVLSLLPYLPIDNLHQAVMDFMRQAIPGQAAKQLESVVAEVTLIKREELLSFGAVATLWAASAGVYAVMQQLNFTYDVRESRPFWKVRGLAIIMTLLQAVLIVGSFVLIVFGGMLEAYMASKLDWGSALTIAFAAFRWVVIAAMVLLSFALMYYFGPDVKQEFKFITPGSLIGALIFAAASFGFRIYVENFSDYTASYGSLGAIVVLMLWLYITGLVILIGSEINALIEHYSPQGKQLGEKKKGVTEQKQKVSARVDQLPAGAH